MEANDTKERIISYLLDKFLTEPTRLDTVDEWARDLGMSKKTIYKHFPAKEHLLSELFSTMLEKQRQMLSTIIEGDESSIHKLLLFINHFRMVLERIPGGVILQIKKHHREVYSIWETYKQEFIDQIFVQMIEGGKKDGHIIADLSPLFLSRFWENNIRNLILQLPYASVMSTRSAFVEIKKIFLRGISTAEGIAELERIGAIK
ncbi:TetR/AcrR family transcriptional regulator [Imperialibacter roseus]|uniref:TetR/AcrR family transcriptional regulator n=1 Tax=Imperialibacter roseus TaxID=1324217 RepID=A0ABZ0IMY8_9BACT|nr:TetR/AcrR family transcriptional regulator [Imperialibacter roseus]WOK05829.1 TetR/AcrR family transcriptional regulator [Imperialibacter roseus]